jgi:hypothetical protein
MAEEPRHETATPEAAGKQTTFQPRVEAEEGEPTRFDYVVLALVVLFIILALLWAFGVVTIPGINF